MIVFYLASEVLLNLLKPELFEACLYFYRIISKFCDGIITLIIKLCDGHVMCDHGLDTVYNLLHGKCAINSSR